MFFTFKTFAYFMNLHMHNPELLFYRHNYEFYVSRMNLKHYILLESNFNSYKLHITIRLANILDIVLAFQEIHSKT